MENLLERYEYKFLIPGAIVPAIRQAVSMVCELDQHAGEDRCYTIRSLYLDTAKRDLFWANEHERGNRFKVRIRNYPGAQAPVFLEVKARFQDVFVKSRVAVPAAGWQKLIKHPKRMQQVVKDVVAYQQAERFLSLYHTHHLEPVLHVEYEREAYVSTIDYYARATLDFHIRAMPREQLDLSAPAWHWHYIDHPVRTITAEPVWVLELKFRRHVPAWMSALVQRFDLIRYEFSKYGYSFKELFTWPELRTPQFMQRRLSS